MNDKNINETAFPVQGIAFRNGQQIEHVSSKGMTLRDYFAAKAMQGMLADGFIPNYVQQAEVISYDYSTLAYRIADSMLKAREK